MIECEECGKYCDADEIERCPECNIELCDRCYQNHVKACVNSPYNQE